eukprot:2191252-Prymnesium_polylepis.1
MCAAGFYRITALIDASQFICSSCVEHADCPYNATLETLQLHVQHWRHSNASSEIWRCESRGSWSPCRGGIEAGDNGGGYCRDGYHGPRCELCVGVSPYSHYLDKIDAICKDCGDVAAQATAVYTVLLALLVISIAGGAALTWKPGKYRRFALKLARRFWTLWQRAGLRYKVKVFVGLFQCIGAIPNVFDLVTPSGLEDYIKWMNVLEFTAQLGVETFIPLTCFGSFREQLVIASSWPIAFLLLATIGLVGWELAQALCGWTAVDRTKGAAIRTGLQRALSMALLI